MRPGAGAGMREKAGTRMARRRAKRPTGVWPKARRPFAAAWRDRLRTARESYAFIVRNWLTTLVIWMLIGIALAPPAALYVIDANLARAAADWPGDAGFSVYFRPGADLAQATRLARMLEDEADIARVRLISPEEALAELADRPAVAEALAALSESGGNPLPATIRATAAPGVPAERLLALAQRAGAAEDVDDVAIERRWLARLAALRDVAARLAAIAAVLLGVGAMLISSACTRLAIESRLAEVRVLALLGADKRFIRRPFIYLGGIYGGGGALASAMLLSAALVWLEPPLARLAASYGADLQLAGFDPTFLVALLALGTALGMLGARIAANRRLRDMAAA